MNDKIEELVHRAYWDRDLNCARTMLLSLAELLQIEICDQTFEAAVGLHGAGGYRAQCGLVEGALMFLGVYFSGRGKEEQEIIGFCFRFAEAFEKQFQSLQCRKLRPGGFREDDPPHMCEHLTVEAIRFACDFIKEIQ